MNTLQRIEKCGEKEKVVNTASTLTFVYSTIVALSPAK
jgi:hypothetical protein